MRYPNYETASSFKKIEKCQQTISSPPPLAVLVHGGVRALYAGGPGQGVRGGAAVVLRRARTRHVRQTGSATVRPRPDRRPGVRRSGLPGGLLRHTELRGDEGKSQVSASNWGFLESKHWAVSRLTKSPKKKGPKW